MNRALHLGWFLVSTAGLALGLAARRGAREAAEYAVLRGLDACIAAARKLRVEEPESVDEIVRRHAVEMAKLRAENAALKVRNARLMGIDMGSLS